MRKYEMTSQLTRKSMRFEKSIGMYNYSRQNISKGIKGLINTVTNKYMVVRGNRIDSSINFA